MQTAVVPYLKDNFSSSSPYSGACAKHRNVLVGIPLNCFLIIFYLAVKRLSITGPKPLIKAT